ncbi:hypothetical protein MLD38_005493 [Melastoma candidum]|uniref:Uncharacterized protein n=1 Tax=Melastoma candidum TaxID=119954 RepID=A0ACB9RKC2_9MYRT|nr:hypothetical protein MLD38_005493 [Melastoma candidum]
MLHFPDPAKLKTRKIVFEDVFPAIDCGTLEQLKELSSKRRLIEEAVNATSMVTEAVAREMSGGLASRTEQDLQKLKHYLPLLENFVSHVEMHGSNNKMTLWVSNLRIQWSSVLAAAPPFSGLLGPKFFQVDNIRFELGLMLFLYAALLRDRAYEVVTSDLVQSTTLFREAAGVYHYLSHDVIPSLQSQTSGQKPPEASSSVTAAMSLMCLAEAQAVTVRKAEERKATASLLVKLHSGVGVFVSEAIHSLRSEGTEVKDFSGRFLEYLSSLKELHELKSKKYLAQDLKSSERISVAIEVLRQALVDAGKHIPGDESWRLILKEEMDEVAEVLRKYENENEIVWHQRISSWDELPAPVGSKMLNNVSYSPTRCEAPLVFKL